MSSFKVNNYGEWHRVCFTLAGVPQDISTATTLKVKIRRPDGTTFERTATPDSESGTGWAKFQFEAGSLSVVGDYILVGVAKKPGTYDWETSDEYLFNVAPRLS